MKPVRFGLVGAGRISQAHSEAFLACDDAELVAVTDLRAHAAVELAERHGAEVAGSAGEMAACRGLDAVLICVEPVAHHSVAAEFLERGIHVLCEKPFTLGTQRAGCLLRQAGCAGVIATMASKFRFVDDIRTARAMISQGVLGALRHIEVVFAAKLDMSNRWNSRPEVSGGGVLADNGSHAAEIVRCLAGEIVRVRASAPVRDDAPVERTARLETLSRSGVLGRIDLSWEHAPEQTWYVRVTGRDGVLELGWQGSRWRRAGQTGWTPAGHGYDKLAAFGANLRNMARAVRGEEDPVVSADDAFASVAVVEAGYESLRSGDWQPVNGHWRNGPEE